MRVLIWLVAVVVVLGAGAVGIGFVLPDTAHVERSVVIDAKPATVFTVLNGFQQFRKWSPWEGLDPNADYKVEGPPVGVGAKQSWRSDDPSVGAGSQEILESVPFERIVMRLVFAGFDSENLATFTLSPQGEGTQVVWSYDSTFHGNLMGRYFGLIMDRMLGPDYERGLTQLKALVETLPAGDVSALDAEVVNIASQPILYISATAAAEEAGGLLAAAYTKIRAYMAAQGLKEAGAPIAITRQYDDETRAWRFDAGLIVDRDDPPAAPEKGIQSGRTYAGTVVRVTHMGSYSDMEATYNALLAFRTIAGFEDNGDSWEQYLSNPATTPESELRADIYWPVQ